MPVKLPRQEEWCESQQRQGMTEESVNTGATLTPVPSGKAKPGHFADTTSSSFRCNWSHREVDIKKRKVTCSW